jgi:hypothetical protein
MKTRASGFFILFILSFNFGTQINASVSLKFGVKEGDILEWQFTELKGNLSDQEKRTTMMVIWVEMGSDDSSIQYGIYLNEILKIKILSVPSMTLLGEIPSSNGDFPKGLISTPRINSTRWISPYVNIFPFVIPIEPVIVDNLPNKSSELKYNEKGVLEKGLHTTNNNTFTIELKNHDISEIDFFTSISLIITVFGTIGILGTFILGFRKYRRIVKKNNSELNFINYFKRKFTPKRYKNSRKISSIEKNLETILEVINENQNDS